jgi:VanZ family protein
MIPSNQLPGERLIPIPHFDKFIHFILFGVFAILWNIHLSKCKSFINDRKRFIVILTGIGVYGLLLELMQNITGRQFDVYDLIADLTGVIIIKYPGLEISPGMNKKNKKLFR